MEGLKAGRGEMFLAKGFEGERREAQLGGPMAVFVFEAVKGLQDAREVATVLFGDLVRDFGFDWKVH